MFPLLRYFTIAGLAVTGVILIALLWLVRMQNQDEMVAMGEAMNLPISRTLGNTLWSRYEALFARAAGLDDEALRADPEIAELGRDVRDLVRGNPVLKVKFFGHDRRTLFSTDPRDIGRYRLSNPPLEAALVGRSTSGVRSGHTVLALDGREVTVTSAGSYVPVFDSAGVVVGAVEVYGDLTGLIAHAQQRALECTAIFAAALMLLCAALCLIVAHGDRILRRQYAALVAGGERERARIAVLWREIAQRQAAERKVDALSEVEATNRAMNSMIANMSHELRTPLNAIIGFSDIIRRRMFGPRALDRYADYAGDIHESADHLLSIINNMLDLAKMQAGRMELHEEQVAVGEAIASAVSMIKPLADRKRHVIDVSVWVAIELRADPQQLKQMLLNLLGNAVKFTPDGGDITVAVTIDRAGWLEIAVADSGIGIRPEDLSRALTPFVQVDDHASRRYQGTGLGLSIVKSLIELHGGMFMLHSIVGIGTIAILRFPPSRAIACEAFAEAA